MSERWYLLFGALGWGLSLAALSFVAQLRLVGHLTTQVQDLIALVRSMEDRLYRTNSSLVVAHESILELQNLLAASQEERERSREELRFLRELAERAEVTASRTRDEIRQSNPSLAFGTVR